MFCEKFGVGMMENRVARGTWTPQETSLYIDTPELLGLFNCLEAFESQIQDKRVLCQVNNYAVCAI